MFLFENLTQSEFNFDRDWAIRFYEYFYQPETYFENLLNKDFPGNNNFCVSKKTSNVGNDVINVSGIELKVSYIDHSDIFLDTFPAAAVKYACQILDEYGKSVTVTEVSEYKSDSDVEKGFINFRYDVSQDVDRWEKSQKNYHEFINSQEFQKIIHPTLEQWIYMLSKYAEKQSPYKIFVRQKDYADLASKAIIAAYLKWDNAVVRIHQLIYDLKNKGTQLPFMFMPCLNEYESKYEPDEEIKELINDMTCYNKNISADQYISDYLLPIVKMLDNDMRVSQYEIIGSFNKKINIKCSNGRLGTIYVSNIVHQEYMLYVKLHNEKDEVDQMTTIVKQLNKCGDIINQMVSLIYEKGFTKNYN